MKYSYNNLRITEFLEIISQDGFSWYIKRLSCNDTKKANTHQYGIYISKSFAREIIPQSMCSRKKNPNKKIRCHIFCDEYLRQDIRIVYYNGKRVSPNKKGKDEVRLTHWRNTTVLSPENTGSICIFAWEKKHSSPSLFCWVCKSEAEEDAVENWLGKEVVGRHDYSLSDSQSAQTAIVNILPDAWKTHFPSGEDIFKLVETLIPLPQHGKTLDQVLLDRRAKEFEIFTALEECDVMPRIERGFVSADDFIGYANKITNRRKSRAGRSLELHLASIFRFKKIKFETQVVTENKKKPDFIFPGKAAYVAAEFPDANLSMLASKTSCKDRWRQILTEADRVKTKHLFTLQEDISANQLSEMSASGIILVIPKPLQKAFSEKYSSMVMDLEGFIDFIAQKQKPPRNPSKK